MKAICLGFLFGLAIAPLAHAADHDPYADLHGQSLFQELAADFATAALPAASDLTGWYAGRCVTESRQNHEHGYVLTFNTDGSSLYMGTVYIKGEHNPAAYDHLDADEEATIAAYLANGQKKDVAPATTSANSVVSVGRQTFWKDFGTAYVRKTSEGFLEKLQFEVDGDWMCYFTRKVK